MSDFDKEPLSATRRLGVIVGFSALCALIFGFLWINSGGKIPLVTSSGYTVSMDVPEVGNLVYFSDVMVAGVKVGKVTSVEERGDHARVEISLDDAVAPLHEGATAQIRAKSLIEESFVEISDGAGPELADGAVLAEGAAAGPVQLNDVLETLDAPTRESVGETLRSLGIATEDSLEDYRAFFAGFGDLGREGLTVTDAIAAQSEDLTELTRSSTQVLASLSTRNGQISQLVDSAQLLVTATAGQEAEIAAVMRVLPTVLNSARTSSSDLTEVAHALAPVVRNLNEAAPALTAAMGELPATTEDLRSMLPALSGVLDTAPATLTKVPALSSSVRSIVPSATTVMSDLNPMLGYLEPYGKDIAAFFTNFSGTLQQKDANGHWFRVTLIASDKSLTNFPISTHIGPLNKWNPLPGPGTLQDEALSPFKREYDRVEEEPVP